MALDIKLLIFIIGHKKPNFLFIDSDIVPEAQS